MSEHTPGPWEVEHAPDALPGRVRAVVGQTVASPHFAGLDDDTIRANARRIVAAVNACEGIPTAALEDGVVSELREALEAVLPHLGKGMDMSPSLRGPDAVEAWKAARAAIAKAAGATR